MFITFSELGSFGRLGNQMFQFAMIKGVANKIGANVIIPTIDCDVKKLSLNCIIKNINIANKYKEKSFNYDANVFNVKRDTDFSGYFQSYKYFTNIEQIIKEEFRCGSLVEREVDDKLKNLGNVVSVHVRRTDYLTFSNVHPSHDKIYYDKGMNYFRKMGNFKFMICSDDIGWCKRNIIGDDVVYSDGNKFVDLAILYKCQHNIIANSSYSWWGAYLNQNKDKIIIYPKNWFGVDGPKDWSDLIPKGWIGF
jgi:hypothetical protein